MNILPAAVQSL